ncbi:GNAT family N-acetyltransferase [Streptomyces boncukensis]|uniref:GNAT family N-acetyltransferase n=1 Tax=Streptomyces boncukensis TaxID=2711219 RepID=A0A6G4WSV7_9ACTN|nr:GNAT family N-acetyltransferase [Streptomyces boncukensis]NGO67932.1 GNAT family N-acetyltransferase [Streptomyces boncukensis]
MRDLVRAWAEGWVVSRRGAPVVEEEWGFSYDIGMPGKSSRLLLPGADQALVRSFTETVTAHGVWLTCFEEPETVVRWAAPGWTLDQPGYLMTTPLRDAPARSRAVPPDGYELRVWELGGVVRAFVVAPDGGFAARGQVAVPDGARTAVVDQVETAPEHRRRRLGSLVMETLAAAARERGCRDAVLGGTPDGRALYSSLGWRVFAPLTDLYRKAPAAAEGADGPARAA